MNKPSVKLLFEILDNLNGLRYSYVPNKQDEWVVDALSTIDEIIMTAIEDGYVCPSYDLGRKTSYPTPQVQLDLFD